MSTGNAGKTGGVRLDKPLIVREYPVDFDAAPVDTPMSQLGPAIDLAQQLAMLSHNRQVHVVDQNNMPYAQFAMLWQVPREYR